MEPRSRPPVLTLTTDFGLSDHYVGTMKGVLISRCPHAQIIDISHQIRPFSIYEGAYAISQAAPYFPPGTVHVVVVDPGVGTERKPVLAESGSHIFIAPDNGVLSLILKRDAQAKLREIANRKLWLENPSSTFHGRDIFAATAGSIAAGAARPEEVGPLLETWETLPDLDPVYVDGRWRGRILTVDHFGNLITNFPAHQFQSIAHGAEFHLSAGPYTIHQFRKTFALAAPGECFVYVGSSGNLEIGKNQESAAHTLQLSPGDVLELLLL
jgi:S-adenosylmethionine hydrolase